MISQDGNTRDESKMRRPELKDRLQAAWDRIDALEAENERLRGAIDPAHLRYLADELGHRWEADELRELADDQMHALDGGGGNDE